MAACVALEHSYVLDWERKKAPLVPPNGMVRALGLRLTFAEASICGDLIYLCWDLIYDPCRHRVAVERVARPGVGGEESRDPIRSCREGAGAPGGSPFRSGAVSGAVRLLADMNS